MSEVSEWSGFDAHDTPFFVGFAVGIGSNGPKRIQEITRECTAIALDRFFPAWANKPTIPLFASCFSILFDANMTTFFGRRRCFVETHGPEIQGIFTSMKPALMDPLARLLPWWASPSGRALKKGSERLRALIGVEVAERVKDVETCREAKDYLSCLIVANQADGYVEDYTEHFVSRLICCWT
jgi:hypothetical protein